MAIKTKDKFILMTMYHSWFVRVAVYILEIEHSQINFLSQSGQKKVWVSPSTIPNSLKSSLLIPQYGHSIMS